MRRRTNLEITAEILDLCSRPLTRTQVMYKANLSWKLSQKYLSKLESQGLLEVHHSRVRYVTTQKGLEFVEKWRLLEELF